MEKLDNDAILQMLLDGNTSDFDPAEPEGELDLYEDFYCRDVPQRIFCSLYWKKKTTL